MDENRVTCFHARRTNFQTLCVFPNEELEEEEEEEEEEVVDK